VQNVVILLAVYRTLLRAAPPGEKTTPVCGGHCTVRQTAAAALGKNLPAALSCLCTVDELMKDL